MWDIGIFLPLIRNKFRYHKKFLLFGMAYIQVRFNNTSAETNDILIALLSELQYEGFEEVKDGLKCIYSTIFI